MKNRSKLILALFIAAGIYATRTEAGSFYNSRGLGELRYFSNAQAIGLGGSLIAVPDRFQINLVNPAALAFIPITRLAGDFIHEATWNKTDTDKGFGKYTNLNGVSFAIPIIRDKMTTAVGIIPTSQFDYEYFSPGVVDDYNYTKKIRASGGLNKISFGLGYAINKYLYLGSYLHYNFGKLEQTWMVDYVSDLFWDTSDKLTRKMWGLNYTGGVITRPISNLYIGAVYSGKYTLTMQDHFNNQTQNGSLSYIADAFKSEKKKLTIPEFWGVGATYVLKNKFLFTSDFIYQPWSNFNQANKLTIGYHDDFRISVGMEMLPGQNILAKYYQRMNYRLGYFYHALNYQDEGTNSVTEYGVTVGAGFPYYGMLGRIDVALRFGKRGAIPANPVEENMIQLYISITGGEKWFSRGQ